MIRHLFDKFKRGEYVHREPRQHSCWLPAGNHPGDIWKCKCGQLWKCRGLSMWADVIEWQKISEDHDKEIELDEDRPEPLWRL